MHRMTHRLERGRTTVEQAAEFSKPVARRGCIACYSAQMPMYLHVSLLTCMRIIAEVAVAYDIHVIDLRCVDTIILSYTDLQVDTVPLLNLK